MKKMIVMMAAVFAVAAVSNAGIYAWSTYDELSNLDPGFDLVTKTGKGAVIGSQINIYQSASARTDDGWYNLLSFSGADLSSELTFGDTLVHSSAVSDDGGWLWVSEDVNLGIGNYYTVLFDVAAPADGDQFIALQTSTFTATVADALPAGNYSTFDGVPAGSVAWQTIPEPATLGLMGVAGLGIFLARKKSNR